MYTWIISSLRSHPKRIHGINQHPSQLVDGFIRYGYIYTMLPELLATCCLCFTRSVISLRLYILGSPDKGIDPALERLTHNEYKVLSQGVLYI